MQLGIFTPAVHTLQIRRCLLFPARGWLGRALQHAPCMHGIGISGKQAYGHNPSMQGDITPLVPQRSRENLWAAQMLLV